MHHQRDYFGRTILFCFPILSVGYKKQLDVLYQFCFNNHMIANEIITKIYGIWEAEIYIEITF